MTDIEKGLLKQSEELTQKYDEYFQETKYNKKISDTTNVRMFIISIIDLVVLSIVVISMCISNYLQQKDFTENNYKVQKEFINFLSQYEYSTDVSTTTEKSVITQENEIGDNNFFYDTKGEK
jgi:hypothetical protein